ncbi:hypothetical protein [Acinetobacter indicus]|uniref:hypothetical protein n=1 Tax=Acinetobacter indicus TaxID=756892 RepID=UPI002574A30F|nr:hypothetical protein [Acinetobacter indicus]MDM1291459.1 hypothetical protein [Acinetobacter indicus]
MAVINHDERLIFLSTFISIGELVRKWIDSQSTNQQPLLSLILIRYIELIHSPFKNDDTNELILNLTYIRADLCQQNKFKYANERYRKICLLIKHMIDESYFKGRNVDGLSFLMCTLTDSQYEACKSEKIPFEVSLKFNYGLPKSDTADNTKDYSLSTTVALRLEYLSGILNYDVYYLISNFISHSSKQRQTKLSFLIKTYIAVLYEALNNNDPDELAKNLHYIRIDLCKRYTFLSSRSLISDLQMLIKNLINIKFFNKRESNKLDNFLTLPTESQFQLIKSEIIPEEISNLFSYESSADEKFTKILNSTCTPEIANRLKEHVNSFKHNKHHRGPLIQFLEQISSTNIEWYKHPRIIQGELLKYRGNLLDKYQRNTAYGRFQNVKNSIDVLVKHGLLPEDVEIPDNLRRCINTEKVRKDNPLICEVDMYDEKKRDEYINTPQFIESLKSELSYNLCILVKNAQEIIFQGYKKFCNKNIIIEQSQFDEFMNHPQLLVSRTKGSNSKSKVSPFNNAHPLRLNNLTAYYNHYFNDLLNGKTQHNINNLAISEDILGYLGLTSSIASAMQTIITEELGINPYSLYRVKISSDGHGHEFVIVDDEGSVRIKALKPRARSARSRKAEGSYKSLADIDAYEINAATCLRMALEMTARIRETLGIRDLWVCLSCHGTTAPCPETFQNKFNKFCLTLSPQNTTLQKATLKKVRASKGVLIYLNSNGDSIKTSTYFGNTVKTTLNRYIPKYLTEIIYRLKIRNFQKIFLFMATSSDKLPFKSLNMSEAEFKLQLKQVFNNPDMGGNLYEKLTNPCIDNEEDIPLYFCVSDLNLQLAIKYAKDGKDEKLKKNCKDVLDKIGQESSVMMKHMLRTAQLNVEKNSS